MFAVGDRKQSIYSFQGADPAGFDRWRAIMGDRVRESGGVFRDTALDVSFRSTAAVLALVDAVFADPAAAAGVVAPGEALRHEADRAGHAGRGGAVAAGAGAAARAARALGGGGPQPGPGDGAAAPGGRAGALDRRADRPGPRCPAAAAPCRRATCWCWCAGATTSPARWCAG